MVVIFVLLLGLGGASWLVFSPPDTLGGQAFDSIARSVASVTGQPAGDDGGQGARIRDRVASILRRTFSVAQDSAGGSCK